MSLIPKSAFVGLESCAHLCTGGEAPWLRSHDAACQRFGALKSGGMAGREEVFRLYARAKAGVARRLGVTAERVAFLGSSSEGVNQAVAAIDWRPGDNAVVADLEYPSLVYPVARLARREVEVRVVKTAQHYLHLDAVAAVMSPRTRLVLVSEVSFLTGQRLDVARLAALARRHGARLLVDATHALGVAPVDGTVPDFLVSSCYKWLLATHGVAVFACDPARVGDLEPATIGWHSVGYRGGPSDPLTIRLLPDAARFEPGNPALLPVAVLDNALATTEPLDIRAVLDHALALGDELIAGLRRRGYEVLTPASRAERAGNVCFVVPEAPALARRLAERGVHVWGSEGRIRVSAHLYNDGADVQAFFDALDR